jgi:coronin-1B/1C/6
MSRVVRSSKFRHVFGQTAKKESFYDNLKPTKSAWDSNKCAANGTFVGVIWDSRGGGSFAVLPNETRGKYPSDLGLVSGHKGAVLDIHFNPFNDNIIGSVSEDGNGRIWAIPDGGLGGNHLTDPVQSLVGHKRKVGTIRFNPTANNVVATSSADYTVKVWDVETGSANITVSGHTEMIQSMDWNRNGSQMLTTSKDKNFRLIDPRAGDGAILHTGPSHVGVKGSRAIFLGDTGKILTVGFGRTSDRQMCIYDSRDLSTKIVSQTVDTASGIIMPFYDNDTKLLFLAGKGDGNVRYYELVDDKPFIHFISEYKSNVPQLGMAFRPKTACDVSICEIASCLKVCGTYVEPISFCVPRKSDLFQDDLFPDTAGPIPTVEGGAWFSGETGEPKLVSLEGGFVAPEKPKFEVKEVAVVDEGPKTEAELRTAWEDLKKRVAYLEAEIVKKDAEIAKLKA